MNYDYEIERKYHPENFNNIPDEFEEAEKNLKSETGGKIKEWFNKNLKEVK